MKLPLPLHLPTSPSPSPSPTGSESEYRQHRNSMIFYFLWSIQLYPEKNVVDKMMITHLIIIHLYILYSVTRIMSFLRKVATRMFGSHVGQPNSSCRVWIDLNQQLYLFEITLALKCIVVRACRMNSMGAINKYGWVWYIVSYIMRFRDAYMIAK